MSQAETAWCFQLRVRGLSLGHMCGIAGYFQASPAGLVWDQLLRMAAAQAHRGPDGEGVVAFPPGSAAAIAELSTAAAGPVLGGFAHRRLSIIDLSTGANQPMSDSSGRYWICYNGEVYNYIELRQELERAGYRFRTSSDTEVVLASYIAWGETCLERFNGMWALAVWDQVEKRLWLSRDRFGIKPLFYWHRDDGFAFASEVKALRTVPAVSVTPNEAAIADYLVHGRADSFEFTFFGGIRQLEPGSAMALSFSRGGPGQPVTTRWWRLADALVPGEVKPALEENAATFRALFTDAVKLRLRSDVPVGTCLSGGIDSSAVVCAAAPFLSQANQNGFSAHYPGFARDETRWIEMVAGQTGIRQHWVTPTAERLAADFSRLLWHQEQPFTSTSIYAQWQVFELARSHRVPVTLDGQGADESLAGYHYFFPVFHAQLLKTLHLASWVRETRLTAAKHGTSWVTQLAGTASGFVSHRRMIRLAGLVSTAYSTAWVDDRVRRLARELSPAPAFRGDFLNQRLAEVFTRSGLPALLRYADRNY